MLESPTAVFSDIHLDFNTHSKLKLLDKIIENVDTVINLGDIANSHDSRKMYFEYIEDNFHGEHIVLPGNHDFWNQSGNSKNPYQYWLREVPSNTYTVRKNSGAVMGNAFLAGFGYDQRCNSVSINSETQMDFSKFRMNRQDIIETKKNVHSSLYGFSHLCPTTQVNPGFKTDWKFDNINYREAIKGSPIKTWFFGHTHRRVDMKLDGVRYINVSIGYAVGKLKPNNFIFDLPDLNLK